MKRVLLAIALLAGSLGVASAQGGLARASPTMRGTVIAAAGPARISMSASTCAAIQTSGARLDAANSRPAGRIIKSLVATKGDACGARLKARLRGSVLPAVLGGRHRRERHPSARRRVIGLDLLVSALGLEPRTY